MTDERFQELMRLEKSFVKSDIVLPANNENVAFDVKSISTRDEFFLDIDRRGKIELSKFKLQNRYAKTKLPLVRIDIDSPPHTNPDGTMTSRNHIHIYRETDTPTGNLPWAYDLDSFEEYRFEDITNFMQVFSDFCAFCRIAVPHIQGII